MMLASHCHGMCPGGSRWLDSLRYLDLVMAAVIFGLAVWVLIAYTRVYRRAPSGRRGLLPAHVALISASYTLALGQVASINVERLGHGYSHAIPINFVVFTTGVAALVYVLQYERKVITFKRKVVVADEIEMDTGDKPADG